MCPSYSIGKESKKATFINKTISPGVGAYNIQSRQDSKLVKTPEIVIGKTERVQTENNANPPVGNYDLLRYSIFGKNNKGFKMGGRDKRFISEGPGPGEYETPKINSSSSKFYSMGKKINQKQRRFGPGPAKYDPNNNYKPIAISFEKSNRSPVSKVPQNFPNPASYNTSPRQQSKKFSFPHRQKFFQQSVQSKQKLKVPGPGTYNSNYNHVKKQIVANKFNRSKRDSINMTEMTPGVRDYSLSNTFLHRSPVVTVGNSPKGSEKKEKSPGPADYNPVKLDALKKKNPSIKFGKSERDLKAIKYQNIGPGTYEAQKSESRYAYSMTGRRSSEKAENRPGPEAYNPNYTAQFRNTQKCIMGRQKRLSLSKERIPGPGEYESQQKKMSKTFYFPKQKKKQRKSQIPGPGAYDIKPIIGTN